MFLNLKKALKMAREKKFAIGAFNVFDLEIVKAVVTAAQKMSSPIIIQTSPKAIEYAGQKQLFDLVKDGISNQNIKAAIHLDHAKDFGLVKSCIDLGYSSVMFDGSSFELEENISITKKVVRYAKEYDVVVEAELGRVARQKSGKISGESKLTDSDEVSDFIAETGIDILAVSVGNEHGAPKGEKLDLDLLSKISQIANLPLAMHGSSGLSQSDIKSAIALGVVKFNIDTNIRETFIKSMTKYDDRSNDPREVMAQVGEAIEKLICDYIKIFGSEGIADEI